jgi:hypothetical protein
MNYDNWRSQSDEQLAKQDIAKWNLEAADGLPPVGRLDPEKILKTLDEWTEVIAKETRRKIRIRRKFAAYREFSYRNLTDAQFKMLILVCTLQDELGVRYNRPFTDGPYDGTDARNLFIHGLVEGFGGTCVSMPVLYTAIARRLDYPVSVVATKGHSFCRWEGQGERFNVEATCPGLGLRTDEHYWKWPYPMSDFERANFGHMESFSPRRELAEFIHLRGICLFEHLLLWPALLAYQQAHLLMPHHIAFRGRWGQATCLAYIMEHAAEQASHGMPLHKIYVPPPVNAIDTNVHKIANQELNRVVKNHAKHTGKTFMQSLELAVARFTYQSMGRVRCTTRLQAFS